MDGSLILGSANLTGGGLDRNHEIVLWTDDADLASRANEIFEGWWMRGETINLERCDELYAEAKEILARETALQQLMELGAFVNVTSPTPKARQQVSIGWEDIGMPEPAPGDIGPTPPTLRLWPPQVRRAFDRIKDGCRVWVKEQAVDHDGRDFLSRRLFADLDNNISAANRCLEHLVDNITEGDWNKQCLSLEKQVWRWLEEIAERQSEDAEWVDQKVRSIMEKVSTIMSHLPEDTRLGEGLRVGYRLDVPHPDSVDLMELKQQIATKLREQWFQGTLPSVR